MISEFKNQLAQEEIMKGIIVYINKKLWLVVLLLLIAVFVFSFIKNNDFLLALSLSLCVAIIAELLLTLILKRQFSTERSATYKLYNDFLEIIGSNGISNTYQYNQIQSIGVKDSIVLCLPKAGFAIIAKRHLNEEQIHTLQALSVSD